MPKLVHHPTGRIHGDCGEMLLHVASMVWNHTFHNIEIIYAVVPYLRAILSPLTCFPLVWNIAEVGGDRVWPCPGGVLKQTGKIKSKK